MKILFNRAHYLEHAHLFEAQTVEDVVPELCEFNEDAEDLAWELAYTRYELAKAEKALREIKSGLARGGRGSSRGAGAW